MDMLFCAKKCFLISFLVAFLCARFAALANYTNFGSYQVKKAEVSNGTCYITVEFLEKDMRLQCDEDAFNLVTLYDRDAFFEITFEFNSFFRNRGNLVSIEYDEYFTEAYVNGNLYRRRKTIFDELVKEEI